MKKNRFIVYDANVSDYAQKIARGAPMYPLEAKEENKTLDTVRRVCRWLLQQGADRDAVVVAVGGGFTTDVAGFAASIYKRGVKYVNVPTTLLGMVDAGFGGKTGVNLDGYKNILGVIRKPEKTEIHPEFLRTLPEREFRSGEAEMLKTFIIGDQYAYEKAVKLISEGAVDCSEFFNLIKLAGKIKKRIVRFDLFEKGRRRKLNLGHTYGHAIEWIQMSEDVTNPYSHGEAVAIGIIKAARLAEERGIAEAGLADRLVADFRFCSLPTELPYTDEQLKAAIEVDKKAEGGKINFVYPKRIGKVVVRK